MTQKQFKEALLRGRGCCLQAARANPERYRKTVLWACRHEVAFDPQCEGSKAWFVYQLIGCYADKGPFLDTLLTELEKSKSNGGWKMLYLAELLSYFAGDGAQAAEVALWRKYDTLYAALMARKRAPNGLFPERDDFSMLCQVLAESREAMARIAGDIGRLYREKSFIDAGDFDWLYETKAKRWLGTLKKLALKSENIAAYLHTEAEYARKWEEASRARRAAPKSGMSLSVWLKKRADPDTVLAYAKAYREEQNPEARAEALRAFTHCPYPDDPRPVMEDTKSDCEALRNMAWRVLENVRHPAVRELAMEQLKSDPEAAWPAFIANYEAEDEELLVRIVKSVPVDFECTTVWHFIQLDIINMTDRGLKAPASLLRYIYETTYCACCREYTLRQMGRRRLLTETILEECLLDSNDNTRAYAARCLKRRKR